MENPNFCYSLKMDDDNRIDKVFWIDARSRADYQSFGDVITFDMTYRTNRYLLPFTPFTGVSHHYQSIMLGFALLRDKTEVLFIWLFRTWLDATNGKAPPKIITDQDIAMGKAIAKLFPNSHNGLCTWHISKKFPKNLHHLYAAHKYFK